MPKLVFSEVDNLLNSIILKAFDKGLIEMQIRLHSNKEPCPSCFPNTVNEHFTLMCKAKDEYSRNILKTKKELLQMFFPKMKWRIIGNRIFGWDGKRKRSNT